MYKPIIGLEIHVELNTKSKMFCSCRNNPNTGIPNSEICPICLGHPGTLPVINKEAVRKVIKTGLALNCRVSEYSKFDRKNYFYPDLPKGYQISQEYMPLCRNGYLKITGRKNLDFRAVGEYPRKIRTCLAPPVGGARQNLDFRAVGEYPRKIRTCLAPPVGGARQNLDFRAVGEYPRKIRIRNIHLEEDVGKLIHPQGKDYSLVDFNRAGIPLMELVTEPDLRGAKETRRFAEEFQLILRYLGVSEADMEKGQFRVEANISLLPFTPESKFGMEAKLGTKVEIKNLNSFRSVERAINYEVKRQTDILNSGKKVIQETRGWSEVRGITFSQRTKEEAHDYRYFPEPDLPPLHITNQVIREILTEIPEFPYQRRIRFKKEYEIGDKEIEIFVQNKDLGEYFEKVMSELRNWVKEAEMKKNVEREEFLKLIKLGSNYLITDLQGLLKKSGIYDEDFMITPENFAEFITLIYQGKISSKIAKDVLEEMFSTGADPSHIIEEKGLVQITDEAEIEKVIKEVISKNQKAVDDFHKGKSNAFQFLIGQIMILTKGKASPNLVNKILRKLL